MTDPQQSEEKYPLLFLFLDDGNKTSRKNKGVFFERSRTQGIMSGATAVFTQWPGHLSSCGLVTIVSIMMIFFCLLMLLASSIKPTTNTLLHPRCLRRSYDTVDPNLFLVHDDIDWQQTELDTLEYILSKYTQCEVELLILREENNKTINDLPGLLKYHYEPPRWKRHLKNKRHLKPKLNKSEEKLDLNINIGANKLLKAFLERRRHFNMTSANIVTSTTQIPRIPTIHDVIIKFPRLLLKNMTKNEFFENGPLYSVWKNFNEHTLHFAARILRLWENGGIAFEIPHLKTENVSDYYKYDIGKSNSTTIIMTSTDKSTRKSRDISPIEENKLLKNMIEVGYSSFRNLPEGLVTVDEEGIHMETKTTCHAFFGEALVQLKQANNETSVSDIIRNTLKTFCVRGAVDSEYCNSVRNK